MDELVLPDTNTLLHFRRIREIPWSSILNITRPTIALAAIVLKELDQKKTKPGSLGKRATKAIQEIDELFDEGGKSLPVRLLAPSDDQSLSARGLNGLVSDDHIIHALLRERDAGNAVVLVTADTSLRLRVRSMGIRAVELSPEYRLPEPPDSAEERIRQAEARVRQLEEQLPRYVVRFQEHGKEMEASGFAVMREEELVRAYEAELDAALESLLREDAKDRQEESVRERRAAKAEYMRSFRKFSEQQAAAEVRLGRIVMLPLVLENEGSVTGKDVRLRLQLPSKVIETISPSIPFPTPPLLENLHIWVRGGLGSRLQAAAPKLRERPVRQPIPRLPRDAAGPTISGFDAEYRVENLPHRQTANLGDLAVLLKPDPPPAIQIDYEVTSEGLAAPSRGNIVLRLPSKTR